MRPRGLAGLVAACVLITLAFAVRAVFPGFGSGQRRQPRSPRIGGGSPAKAPAVDKDGEEPGRRRGRPWGRVLLALAVVSAGAGCVVWGATTFDRYATPQIPAQLSGYRNSVKVDVPSRFDGPGGQLNSEPYFTTCSVSATYGHWDYPPSFADYSAQPDEYWPQEITVVLPLAKSAEVPDRLTLVLAGTAAIPNGLGAEPSITWNRFSDGLEVDGGTAADTVTWGQPYPDDYITFVVPGPGTRFTLRFADGELVVGHEDVQLRILFRSKVKSPVGVEQGVRTTVNLPLMWGVSWESPLWGNPACGTATATARLKGSLTNSARYRLDSGANVDDTGYEVARTVVSPKEPFYGTTIYSTSAPQLSFIDRNAEAAAQRKATIATSFWVAAGLGVIPLGLQVFPWGAVRRSTAERPARSG